MKRINHYGELKKSLKKLKKGKGYIAGVYTDLKFFLVYYKNNKYLEIFISDNSYNITSKNEIAEDLISYNSEYYFFKDKNQYLDYLKD